MEQQKKKTVLVTGADGNLGKAVMKKFNANNFQVVGTRHQQEYEYIAGAEADLAGIDLVSAADCRRLTGDIGQRHGGIDVAVLTVGGFAMGNLIETDAAALQRQYRLNFETAYNVVRSLIAQPQQPQQKRIFFIGALPALYPEKAAEMVAYSLSKSLLFQLTGIINTSADQTGVAASVIVPSVIDTPENREAMPDADRTQWESADDIAGIIASHATDAIKDFPAVISVREALT